MIKEIGKEIKGFLREKLGLEGLRIKIEEPKRKEFGDISTNAAFIASKELKEEPRKIAQELSSYLSKLPYIEKAEVAGPGFVNIFFSRDGIFKFLKEAEEKGYSFGDSNIGEGKTVLVEFVSANPTGPLHVGHGRGAALGDALSRILKKAGFSVLKEYYINDAGTQMEILGRSVYLRYLELFLKKVDFPEDHYQGDYIVDIARKLKEDKGEKYLDIPEDKAVEEISSYASTFIMDQIKKDLKDFGVFYDNYYSERDIYKKGLLEKVINILKNHGYIYEMDGALWFKSTPFGDEKDRVIRRRNGQYTYFATDIAYHYEKFRRGFRILVNIWGADHHGYVDRIKGAVKALGDDPNNLKILLVQMVNLIKGGKVIPMSTRKGEFYTLRKLMDEVGKDAARFIYLTRDHNSPLDFDIDKAKEMSSENPVFYVQYCHARVCSMKRKARERGIKEEDYKDASLEPLTLPEEKELAKKILFFPSLLEEIAETFEPHKLTYYLYDLSSSFHSYYNKHRVIGEEKPLTLSRLFLSEMVRRTVEIGLDLLGVSAPESM